MLTPKISGIFDCRKYDQSGKKSHEQREMVAEGDNIGFSVRFPVNQVPECFTTNGTLDSFAKLRSSKREKEDAAHEGRQPICDVVDVKFKIGKNCKWFDKFAKEMTKPANAVLDAGRWNTQLDFTKKEKTSDPLSPSGYRVNAIMISPIEQNPFTGQAFEACANDPEVDDDPQDDLPFN